MVEDPSVSKEAPGDESEAIKNSNTDGNPALSGLEKLKTSENNDRVDDDTDTEDNLATLSQKAGKLTPI